MQRALIHVRVDPHPLILLVVGGKVLDAGADAEALHALDEGGGALGREVRILGVVLEVAPTERVPLQVDCRTEHDRDALRAALPGQAARHLAAELGVPAGGHANAGRKARRRDRLAQPEVIRALLLLTQPMRAVRHHDLGKAEAWTRLEVPEARARAHRRLLLERHLANERARFLCEVGGVHHFFIMYIYLVLDTRTG